MPSIHPTPLRLCAATAGALTLATTTAIPAAAEDYPGFTVSRYTPLTTTDTATAQQAGCAAGDTGRDGVRVLFFGSHVDDNQLREPGTSATSTAEHAPASQATDIAKAWTAGFTECRTNNATADLALAVNTKTDGDVDAATAGQNWAEIVNNAASHDNSAVTITGGVDAEPSWSPPSWAREWVNAFTQSSSRTLYAANSADGCPDRGSSVSCANGWKLSDLYYISTGAAPTIKALPQIYRTDGFQARQWATISAWGVENKSGPVRFAGSLSQRVACGQRGGCANTNNTAKAAWTQLRDALNANPKTAVDSLPTASDVRWPDS